MADDRFDELASLYADGRASAAELAEFAALLEADPERRRAFVDRMRLEVGLSTLFTAEAAPALRRSWGRPAAAVAAGLAAAILLTVWLAGPAPQPETEPAPVARRPLDGQAAARAESIRRAEEERARAEADRRRKEELLAALRAKELEADRERQAREKEEAALRQAEATLARLQAERRAAEDALRAAELRAQQAVENTAKLESLPLPQPPGLPPTPPTQAAAARLDRIQGEVAVLSPAGRSSATAGLELPPGSGLECVGPRSYAVVSFGDRTRVGVSGGAVVRGLKDAGGKELVVEKGAVRAEVVKQAQPMLLKTPHGEAKVLGTTFRLVVDPDPRRGTSLEVAEGRVALKNAAGKSLEVGAGRMATSSSAGLAARALPKEEILFSLDFEDGKPSPIVATGAVERGPERAGNRFCLAGEPEPSGVSRYFLGDGALGIFTVQGDEVLSFDYWAEPDTLGINFNLLDRTQGKTFAGEVPKIATGKWARASIRVADLGAAGSRIAPEDWIVNLYLQSVGVTPRKIYIDNLQITRPRVLKPRPSEDRK